MRKARVAVAIAACLFSAPVLAADTVLNGVGPGDWFAQFVFSKANQGGSLVVEDPVCTYHQPHVGINTCQGTVKAQQCVPGDPGPANALFNTTDPPDHCPAICPGGNTGGGQTEITCFDQNNTNLFQLFLGNFAPGQVLKTRLDVDHDRDGVILPPLDVSWHSDPSKDNDLMPDGTPFDHLRTTILDPAGAIRLEWEDLPFAVSDQDFNDDVFLLLRYPTGITQPVWKFGNTIPKQPLYFVTKLDVDDTDVPAAQRMLHLTITVYNGDTTAKTIAVCPMVNLDLNQVGGIPLTGKPDGTQGANCFPPTGESGVLSLPYCFFEKCLDGTATATASAAACTVGADGCTPTGAGSPNPNADCDVPNVRFSLSDGRFVANPPNDDLQVVQPATPGSDAGPAALWAFSAPLNQFVPPLDNLTAAQILQAVLNDPEQIYADFFILPDGGLGALNPPMQAPFRCPSGYDVDTHLEGSTKLPFAFAWTAPITEINSPTTFQTSMRNEVTMQSAGPTTAQTELVWRESDPGNPIGITWAVNPPPRTPFVMDPAVPSTGYGNITFNFPTGAVPEGFAGVATQYTTDLSTNNIIVAQTFRSVKDTHPPVIEGANVARDSFNQFGVALQASDSPATIRSVKIQTLVTGAPAVPAFLKFQSGNYLTSTVFGLNVAAVSPAATVTMEAVATDEVGNSIAAQLPVAHAGLDRTVECTSPAGAVVTLDSSRTTGAPPLTFQWTGPFGAATGPSPARTFPIGTSIAGLTVVDPSNFTSSDDVVIIVQDTTPPTIVLPPAVSVSSCADTATVRVGQATATDACTATPLTPTGRLVAVNGAAVVPPVPVVGGQVALRVGTNTIQWTVSDGKNTATANQTVVLGSKIQASQSFVVDDRGQVLASGGGFAAILNAGTGPTTIGNDCRSGSILSKGPVTIAHRSTVNGSVTSSGTVTAATDASVTGTITGGAPVTLPATPALPTFPTATLSAFTVQSGTSLTRPPGSYLGTSTVNGGTLILSAGDYFFRSLTINAGSTVRVTPTTRVFVHDALIFNAPFRAGSGTALQPIVLGFAGTNLSLTAQFNGTLVAPSADVIFGTGAGVSYTGSFFARVLEITPASTLLCN